MNKPRYGRPALQSYLSAIWRRKWIVVLMLVFVPVSVVAFASRQPHLYRASAQDIVVQAQLSSKLSGSANTKADPTRWLADQATVAQSIPVAELALYARNPRYNEYLNNRLQPDPKPWKGPVPKPLLTVPNHPDEPLPNPDLKGFKPITPAHLLKQSSVSPNTAADVLVFQVTNANKEAATALTNAYAEAFIAYRNEADARTAGLLNLGFVATIRSDQAQLAAATSTVEATNAQQEIDKQRGKQSELLTLQQQQSEQNHVVQPATGASLVQPLVMRAAIVGVLLGLVLGLALAALAEALDSRPRAASAFADLLGLELLGRLPSPSRRVRRSRTIVTMNPSASTHGEVYRKLRTNMEFAMLRNDTSVVVITSAVAGEGKTTTAVNLAVAFARTGRRVALVDLDLRKPQVNMFFELPRTPGVVDVLTGQAEPNAALRRIDVGSDPGLSYASNGAGPHSGLDVMTSGPDYSDPDQLLASHALQSMIADLKSRYDLVLIDTPPMLPVSDVMTLSPAVDALVLVTRAGAVKRQMLEDVQRQLTVSPAKPLGFVLTASEAVEGYGYGYGGYSTYGYGPQLPEPLPESHPATRER